MKLSELLESLKPGDSILMLRTVVVYRKDGSGGYNTVVTDEDDQYEIVSKPPTGHFAVKNLYVDSGTGKLVVIYDNTPAP